MNGYTGEIARINLTTRQISVIQTSTYEMWGGGHGMGSAIFWDLVPDKTIDGFDPGNVVTIMTSPFAGTMVPGASSRAEIQGIGVQSSPIGWYTRGNVGGRFAAMLKYAGYDGIVLEGKADTPVWIDIRNRSVTIRNAETLWGKGTRESQEAIWADVLGTDAQGDWVRVGSERKDPRTTQKPAVLAIGPAGENLSRMACLIHDAGHAVGQGGFGGVWGSKNLKAVSVMGTGSVAVANPGALVDARLWAQNSYGNDLDNPAPSWWTKFGSQGSIIEWDQPDSARRNACIGCHRGCHERSGTGLGNQSTCQETSAYRWADEGTHGRQTDVTYQATDLLQQYGINAYEAMRGLIYVMRLYAKGILGPGFPIDWDLPFSEYGEISFYEAFVKKIANREGIGNDFAEGFYRAADKWGRLEEDLGSGLLDYPYWGLPEHGYDPRAETEWGYGSILGDRDINEHDFNSLYWVPSTIKRSGGQVPIPAETVVTVITEKLAPYTDDPRMLDYSTANIYSEHMAKLVAWHRHYTRFWKQSILFCDQRWPDLINTKAPDLRGISGEGEPRFFNAVTGKNLTFTDGMDLGKKIWNLDNAIWTLQGRHRDMVHFAEYIYTQPFGQMTDDWYFMTGIENGQWDYISLDGRLLEREKFEVFKTRYYKLEGWGTASGWPKRSTLENLGLGYVADVLETDGKLGVDSDAYPDTLPDDPGDKPAGRRDSGGGGGCFIDTLTDTGETMSRSLLPPDRELAQRLLKPVNFKHLLTGYRLRERSGPMKTDIFSFSALAAFLAAPHAVLDFSELARWTDTVLEDKLLAGCIAAIAARDASPKEKTDRIGDLVKKRLHQCRIRLGLR